MSVRTQPLRHGSSSTSQASLGLSHQNLDDFNSVMSSAPRSECQLEPFVVRDPSNARSAYSPHQPMVAFEMPEFLQPAMDFPMNWLPPDHSVAIDYDNIIGLGIGSLDFFSLPDSTTDLTGSHTAVQAEPTEVRSLNSTHIQTDLITQHNAHRVSASEQGTPWSNTSHELVGSRVSSESPHSVTHAVSPSDAPGGLYATSINGARLPCTIRARRAVRRIPGAKPIRPLTELRSGSYDRSQSLCFPTIDHILIENVAAPAGSDMPAPILANSIYEEMQRSFSRLCLNKDANFPLYKTSDFPDLASLNMCIQLYYENFDTIMPILHDQVTRINDHWLLALAVSAIGCQYAEADEYFRMVEPLHEFLRRAIILELNSEVLNNIERDRRGIALAQAMTLNQIGMLYSGSSALLHFARSQHSAMIELARTLAFPAKMSEATLLDVQGNACDDSNDTAWRSVLFDECKRRVGYTIWLLDCMAIYHFEQQPLMPLDLAPTSLPNDKLWQTASAAEWHLLADVGQTLPSLSSATVALFREKQVMPELGQFSRVILLHSVYREIFHLKDYFARPLGNWIPSLQQATIDNCESIANPSNSGHRGRSLLNSWRNAALDCVDVLHWAANGTIALQAGAEHPTVLHLHLSRTVLLAPFDRFQILANSVVSITHDSASRSLDVARHKQVLNAERDILEWAQRDPCKARLAVLHSGCLFWHIRRYSCRAFYEPMAVFLATLTIWAYSSYASRIASEIQKSPKQPDNYAKGNTATHTDISDIPYDATAPSAVSDDDAEPTPTFIHLDRPNDDEMVQTFVRFGTATAMRANITGVGDIYSPKGPARVLKEGRKILAMVSTAWGRNDKFASVLDGLEQIASGRMTLELGSR